MSKLHVCIFAFVLSASSSSVAMGLSEKACSRRRPSHCSVPSEDVLFVQKGASVQKRAAVRKKSSPTILHEGKHEGAYTSLKDPNNQTLTMNDTEVPDFDGNWVLDADQMFFYDRAGHEKTIDDWAEENLNHFTRGLVYLLGKSWTSTTLRVVQHPDHMFETQWVNGMPTALINWSPSYVKNFFITQLDFPMAPPGLQKLVQEPPRKTTVSDDRIPWQPERDQIPAAEDIRRSDDISSSWVAWMNGSEASYDGVGCKRCSEAESLVFGLQLTFRTDFGAGKNGVKFRYRVGDHLWEEFYNTENGWTILKIFRPVTDSVALMAVKTVPWAPFASWCEPTSQVRFFIIMYCLSLTVGLVMHKAGALRFYRLLCSSRIAPDQRRGLGYTASKAYGIFPICRLSETGFVIVGWLLVFSLLLACHPHLAPRFFLFASFGLYFPYFGQLFCESKHGGHGTLLMPSVLLLLALSGGPDGSPWSLIFIKIFLGVVYFAGAVSKVVVSVLFGQRWCGATLQAYVFDALWSRPHSLPAVRKLQHFLLTRWWACSVLAISGLAFEFGWLPAVLFGGPVGAALAAAVAVSFHIGVSMLQGLDFLSFWCPVFWAFLPDLQVLLSHREVTPAETWTAVLAQGFYEEPCRWLMSAAYVLLQVIVAVRLMDFREGMECLPLTCRPMFAVPRNVFGYEVRGGVFSDVDLRKSGNLDFMYNFFPWHLDLPMDSDDLSHLPGRVLMWMSTSHCHPLMSSWINPEFFGIPFLICANFDVSEELRKQIEDVVKYLDAANADDWADPTKVTELLSMHSKCRALFEFEAHPNRCGHLDDLQKMKILQDSLTFTDSY